MFEKLRNTTEYNSKCKRKIFVVEKLRNICYLTPKFGRRSGKIFSLILRIFITDLDFTKKCILCAANIKSSFWIKINSRGSQVKIAKCIDFFRRTFFKQWKINFREIKCDFLKYFLNFNSFYLIVVNFLWISFVWMFRSSGTWVGYWS